MNPLNPLDYIKKGFSEQEAYDKVEQNKQNLVKTIDKKHALKLFEKLSDHQFDDDYKIEVYKKLKNLKLTGRPCMDYVQEIASFFNISIKEAIDSYITKIEFYKSAGYTHITTTRECVIDIFGEDSPAYQRFLDKCERSTSSDFASFKERHKDLNLSDEELRSLSRETYGANNRNRLVKKHNITSEEADAIVQARMHQQKETYNKKPQEEKDLISKSKGLNIQNYINKYGEDQGTAIYNDKKAIRKNRTSLGWYISKYGEEEGKKIHAERKGRHKNINCVEYWTHKGYSEKEADKILKEAFSKRPNFSKQFCIEKYGKKTGIDIWRARQEKWQQTLKSKSAEEIAKINKSKAHTLENYIAKYGEEEGRQKYNNCYYPPTHLNNVSKISLRFFIKVYRILRKLNLVSREDVYWGIGDRKEYFISDKEKRATRFYDFTIPKYRIIVEFNGEVFHPREGDYTWVSMFGTTYEEVFNRDTEKRIMAEKRGFRVLYVWEKDVYTKPDEVTQNTLNNIINLIVELNHEEN